MKKLSAFGRSLVSGVTLLTMIFGLCLPGFAANTTNMGEMTAAEPAPITLDAPAAPAPMQPIYGDPDELAQKKFMYEIESSEINEDGSLYMEYRYSTAGKLSLLIEKLSEIYGLEETVQLPTRLEPIEEIDLPALTGEVNIPRDKNSDGLYEEVVMDKAEPADGGMSREAVMAALAPLTCGRTDARSLCARFTSAELEQHYATLCEATRGSCGMQMFIIHLDYIRYCEVTCFAKAEPCG